MHVHPYARCTNCGSYIPIYVQQIPEYFSGKDISCPSCSEKLDWWKVTLREIHDNFMLNQAFMQIGANSKIFPLELRPNKRSSYKLSDYGIPDTAKILYVNYTPYTGGNGHFPIEITGNVPTRKFPRNEVVLWPIPLGEGTAERTEVSVYVTWIDHSSLDESWLNLINAFEFYVSEQYDSCIVPANVAVESSLSILLTKYLEDFVGKEQVRAFLEDGATYSHQLNVVLPLIAQLNKIHKLPNHIRGLLNKLRSLRNQMAHNGKLDAPLAKELASELLCSSLFGLRYIQYVQMLLGVKI